eukprot:RCo049355
MSTVQVPAPPAWEVVGHPYHGLRRNPSSDCLPTLHRQHGETITQFREFAAQKLWAEIHAMHYDWWMFPVERNPRPGAELYDVLAHDISELKADPSFMAEYREGVRLAALAWGWDVDLAQRVDPLQKGMGWTGWDFRLAKMIRSLWLFQETRYFISMQAYARQLKPRGGFVRSGESLDEIMLMTLPLRTQRYYSPAEVAEALGVVPPVVVTTARSARPPYSSRKRGSSQEQKEFELAAFEEKLRRRLLTSRDAATPANSPLGDSRTFATARQIKPSVSLPLSPTPLGSWPRHFLPSPATTPARLQSHAKSSSRSRQRLPAFSVDSTPRSSHNPATEDPTHCSARGREVEGQTSRSCRSPEPPKLCEIPCHQWSGRPHSAAQPSSCEDPREVLCCPAGARLPSVDEDQCGGSCGARASGT